MLYKKQYQELRNLFDTYSICHDMKADPVVSRADPKIIFCRTYKNIYLLTLRTCKKPNEWQLSFYCRAPIAHGPTWRKPYFFLEVRAKPYALFFSIKCAALHNFDISDEEITDLLDLLDGFRLIEKRYHIDRAKYNDHFEYINKEREKNAQLTTHQTLSDNSEECGVACDV